MNSSQFPQKAGCVMLREIEKKMCLQDWQKSKLSCKHYGKVGLQIHNVTAKHRGGSVVIWACLTAIQGETINDFKKKHGAKTKNLNIRSTPDWVKKENQLFIVSELKSKSDTAFREQCN